MKKSELVVICSHFSIFETLETTSPAVLLLLSEL